jgi:hypothetical protein
MPLSRNVLTKQQAILRVTTDYGYGWSKRVAQETKFVETPPDFHFIAEIFWEAQAQVVAVLGQIKEQSHPLDGLQVCALPVPYVEIDFDANQGNYFLLISPKRPCLTGKFDPPHPESVTGSGYPEYRGYARTIFAKY